MTLNRTLIIICGPTASGKSSIALDIASKLDGEIVNADSMQIYKEIPILTASPSIEGKAKIKHHLYNYKSIREEYSVSEFIDEATGIIDNITQRGKTPILVGGTGLYIKSLCEGLNNIPEIPDEVRDKVRKIFAEFGNKKFYDMLKKVDAKATSILHFSDSQRLMRAYEVILHTKKSIYDFHAMEKKSPLENYNVKTAIITGDRQKLYNKINTRFDQMLSNGAIEEVEKVADITDPQKVRAIGYKEIYDYIKGKISLEEAIRFAQAKSRQYAKRQITWFNRQIKGEKFDMDSKDIELYLSS